MASTARLMRINSLTDPHEAEAAARAKMKAEEKEKMRREAEEKAQRVAEEDEKQKGNWGGLFKMVGDDEFVAKDSPETRRPTGGDAAYPVGGGVSVGVKSNNYKKPPISGGGLFNIFSKEPEKTPETTAPEPTAAPEPETNNAVSDLPPPPVSGEAQLIIAKLFEQLAAERERGNRLELQGEESTFVPAVRSLACLVHSRSARCSPAPLPLFACRS